MRIVNVTPTELQPLGFVEVWSVAAERKPSMAHRRDICDENHGKSIAETGPPPAHPNCECTTALVLLPKEGE